MRPAPAGASLARASDAQQRRLAAAWRSGALSRLAAAKRAIDLVVGIPLLLVSLPVQIVLCAVSAAALRTWPLFVQLRPGRDGRLFRIIKIRTLPRTVPAYGHKTDLAAQMRTAPAICRLLRRTHLDELPQLALVPLGRMSLVGPRPSQPLEFEHIGDTFEWMRTAVRPGCTGLWQIGAAHDGSLDAAPEYDTVYLERASVRLDLWILCRTVLFMLRLVPAVTIAQVPSWTLRGRAAYGGPESEPPPGWDGATDVG
jgi:lipopolysaccharide/colanic/teichoic acid biosynthesis glycosyltransferase